MHRFYLPAAQCQGASLTLTDAEAHHALRVLRLQPGDAVVVLDGEGGEFSCLVRQTDRRTVALDVQQARRHAPLPWRLTLFQALPKGKVFDTIVQKATELGAGRIVPVLSARVVARPAEAQFTAKLAHWRRTAIEAVKQCGSPWLPQIDPPIPLATALGCMEPLELVLVGALPSGSRPLPAVLRAFRQQHQRPPASVGLWIGPEGDFTPDEYAALQNAGAVPVTLGPWVLRADTAAIAGLAVIHAELQAGGA